MTALGFVNATSANADSSGTTVSTAAFALTSGNHVAVYIRWESSDTTIAITDTAGNTYTAMTHTFNSQVGGQWFYSLNVTGHAANVVTATFAAARAYKYINAIALSGSTPTVTDQANSGSPTNSVMSMSSSMPVGAGGMLLVGESSYGNDPVKTWSQTSGAFQLASINPVGTSYLYAAAVYAPPPTSGVRATVIYTGENPNLPRVLNAMLFDIGGVVEVLPPQPPINDRDLLLQATVPRFTAATTNALLLSAATPFFHVNSSGTPSPSSITVTATLMGGLAGTVAFTTAGGSTITTTPTTATLTYAALAAATSEVINASITQDGTTYTAAILLTKVVDGASGTAQRVAYSVTTLATLATTPATITTSGGSTSFPPNNSWGAGTIWVGAPTSSLAAGESLYRSDGSYDAATGNTVWSIPYLATLKVGQLSAIAVDAGSITAGDFYGVTIHGGPGYPTNAYTFPTGSTNGGFHLSAAGLLIGNFNAGKYFQITSGGDIYAPGFTVVAGAATFSGALSAASGTFAGSLSAASGTFSGTLTSDAVDAIDTINIAGEAVTIPRTEARTDAISGIGSNQVVMSKTITLTQDGTVQVICTCSQSSDSGDHNWNLWLQFDGVTVSFAGGSAPSDSVALSGALFLTAGLHTITLLQNSGGGSRVINRNFTILGAMR